MAASWARGLFSSPAPQAKRIIEMKASEQNRQFGSDLLTFSIPFGMFLAVERNVEGSFLEREQWQELLDLEAEGQRQKCSGGRHRRGARPRGATRQPCSLSGPARPAPGGPLSLAMMYNGSLADVRPWILEGDGDVG